MCALKFRVVLDDEGGFVMPKPIRDRLKISAGDSVEMTSSAEEIILRPLRKKSPRGKPAAGETKPR